MNFSFHNHLSIQLKNKKYNFYNTVLKSTLQTLANFQKYNEFISIGTGLPDNTAQNNFHLTNHIHTEKLSNYSIQSDISKGNLFAKYEFVIDKSNLNTNYLTEVGLSNNADNPTIYNYFSLISEELPNGLNISDSDEIVFEITIYLNINEGQDIILTSGKNYFIEFLLGNGLGDVFICSGLNYSENVRIKRQMPESTKILCDKISSINNDSLEIKFEGVYNSGEINEILYITNNTVFARRNLKEFNEPITKELTISPKANYVIKIDSDLKAVDSVVNQSTNETESYYFVSKFANSFGDKVNLPFNNIFNSTTSRFISKDGDVIFFILNDKVYAYKNSDFNLIELNTKEINDNYILNILIVGNAVFVISKIQPFISTYIIQNNNIKKIKNTFDNFDKISDFEELLQSEATKFNNEKYAIGIIKKDRTSLTIFLNYDETNGFSISSYKTNNKQFDYILGMINNKFCDGRLIFLKEGETSALCRMVTYLSDETETDIYTSLAYNLVNGAKKNYCKNRAIISEKTTSPSVIIYYYPQIYKYDLPLISNELKDYISNDLNYIIQKNQDSSFSIYNLVGYDTPEAFIDGIPSQVNQSKIIDFEFLKDTLLIFQNVESEPIIAFNLNLNKTQIENVSDKESSYKVVTKEFNKLGKNSEQIKFSLKAGINLWFFLKKFLRLLMVKTHHFLQ